MVPTCLIMTMLLTVNTMFCETSSSNRQLTIASVFAHTTVHHQIPWHIRGYLLGIRQLQSQFAGVIKIKHKFIWARNVSLCGDVGARVVDWATKLYYQETSPTRSIVYCSPSRSSTLFQTAQKFVTTTVRLLPRNLGNGRNCTRYEINKFRVFYVMLFVLCFSRT